MRVRRARFVLPWNPGTRPGVGVSWATASEPEPEPEPKGHDLGGPARFAAAVLLFYKRFLSPLLPEACRFDPTCSVYSREAFLEFGFRRGLSLSLRRLMRCHPFHKGGHDPVPARPIRPAPETSPVADGDGETVP
jgi:hypothetical protein